MSCRIVAVSAFWITARRQHCISHANPIMSRWASLAPSVRSHARSASASSHHITLRLHVLYSSRLDSWCPLLETAVNNNTEFLGFRWLRASFPPRAFANSITLELARCETVVFSSDRFHRVPPYKYTGLAKPGWLAEVMACLQVVNSWFKAPALLQQPDPELERHRKISYYIKCIDVMLYYNTSQSACK